MRRMNWIGICMLFTLTACEELPLQAVGQLESDRVELVVEFAEAIIEIGVTEGDQLTSGDLLLQQDTARVDIKIQQAQASIVGLEAVLAEQISGPRLETIHAAEANLTAAKIERDFRQKELQRLDGLRERNLTSIGSVDTAQNLAESASIRIEFVAAQLAELKAGTRPEKIQQTNASILQAQAQLAGLELDRRRLSIIAPLDSIVDSLPFEVGERPRQGDVVAVLLSGEQPYARVYIPEAVRTQLSIGSQLQISVDGVDSPLTGTIRRIASEASFTPYFALTERDRGRLSYVAEIALPELADRLPEGVPVQVNF